MEDSTIARCLHGPSSHKACQFPRSVLVNNIDLHRHAVCDRCISGSGVDQIASVGRRWTDGELMSHA